MRKQLSIGILLALTASTAVGEEVWQASWIGVAETSGAQAGPSTKGPDIVIQKARYGVPGNPAKQVMFHQRGPPPCNEINNGSFPSIFSTGRATKASFFIFPSFSCSSLGHSRSSTSTFINRAFIPASVSVSFASPIPTSSATTAGRVFLCLDWRNCWISSVVSWPSLFVISDGGRARNECVSIHRFSFFSGTARPSVTTQP